MVKCRYCGCDDLVKNGSTRGVPKSKCKKCSRQTSLRGTKVEDSQEKLQSVLFYLNGLSLNAIAALKSVAPSTILRSIRRFAEQRAAKPQPGPGGVTVMERDEVWHFIGNKANKLWIGLAFCRDTGQLVDWECGDRDQATLDKLLDRLKAWNVRLYCTDSYIGYDRVLPVGRHYQGKQETWRLEQINSRLRHWLARLTAFGVASRPAVAPSWSQSRLKWLI